MEKIINKLINEFVKGADIYKTGNGSTWLIFTDNKQWIIELTESKTLWYNYNFFKNIFNYASMDVAENQHYITKWVEDNIINGVNETESWDDSIIGDLNQNGLIDIVIKDGVKETKYNQSHQEPKFKEVLDNEIIMSNPRQYVTNKILDDTIETGVKKTQGTPNWTHDQKVSNVIDNGVKETKISPTFTENGDWLDGDERLDEIIKNGVKETNFHRGVRPSTIKKTIENGVKETRICNYIDPKTNILYIKWDVQIDNVIKTGIKEVQPLPSQEGDKDWGIYYHGKEDRTKPHTDYVDEVIKFGVKN